MKELPQSSDTYQVYFFSCPAHKPFHFARHLWVVTVSPKGIDRFEVLYKKESSKERYGYIHKNNYAPTQGIRKFPGSTLFWKSTLISRVTGNEGSLAERITQFIYAYSSDYLYKDTYRSYPGPNSNTYIAWILSKFPEANIRLPWNAFGKNYLK